MKESFPNTAKKKLSSREKRLIRDRKASCAFRQRQKENNQRLIQEVDILENETSAMELELEHEKHRHFVLKQSCVKENVTLGLYQLGILLLNSTSDM